eukprot:EG_transcript_4703
MWGPPWLVCGQRALILALCAGPAACFLLGVFLPAVTIKGQFVGEGAVNVTRSTAQGLRHFFAAGYLIPGLIVLTFSVVVPTVKCLCIGCVVPALVTGATGRLPQYITYNTLSFLRLIAKYQLVDVFVTLLTVSFLRQGVLETEAHIGLAFFTVFSVMSIVLIGQCQAVVAREEDLDGPIGGGEAKEAVEAKSPVEDVLDGYLLRATCGLFLLGYTVALLQPMLSVKVTFHDTLVVSEKSQTLPQIATGLLAHTHTAACRPGKLPALFLSLPVFLFVATTLLLPPVFAGLAFASTFVGCPAAVLSLLAWLGDWHMADVLALALLTALLGLNAFPALSAELPGEQWTCGFYFVLLMGSAMADMNQQVAARLRLWTRVLRTLDRDPGEGELVAFLPVCPGSSPDAKPAGESPETITVQALLRGLGARLTGTVLAIKAIGWAVFFWVWFASSGPPLRGLPEVNAALGRYLPEVNSALAATLPESVGACATAPAPCLERGDLYHEKGMLYEVRARWISGLRSTKVQSLVVSTPQYGTLEVALNAVIKSLPMSVYVGYIIPHATEGPLWDDTTACCGSDKRLQVVFRADCSERPPYVQHFTIRNVSVDLLAVHQSILGIEVQLADITEAAKGAVVEFFRPFLKGEAFIPWQTETLTLGQLLTKLIALNTDGRHPFLCPRP